MGAIIDIVTSLAIRGAIVLAVLNMTISLQQKLSEKTSQANEVNLVGTVSAILRYDMDKIGYNWTSGPPYFSIASSDTIEFVYSSTRAPSSPSQWRVRYYLGSTAELPTPNPSDRILYKMVNGGSSTIVTKGIVRLKFQYFDVSGNLMSMPVLGANLNLIRSFSVDLIMAAGDPANGTYPASEWSYRFYPSNIN